MKYLTYSGNALLGADLPDHATVLYPPPAIEGIPKRGIPRALREALEQPVGMEPLAELVGPSSRVLIAFDDNCQPFPLMARPDIRQIMITRLLELLEDHGVKLRGGAAPQDAASRAGVHAGRKDHGPLLA
jgi:hypothetical protein